MQIHDPTLLNAVFGGIGGLVGVIVREHGCIYLPRIRDHRLYLNSLTGVILGTVAGLIGDQNWLNCLMWGIGGSVVITGIVEAIDKKTSQSDKDKQQDGTKR